MLRSCRYVAKPGASPAESSRPRELTNEEIDEVLSGYREPVGVTASIRKTILMNFQNAVSDQLMGKCLTPLGLRRFCDISYEMHAKGRAKPGKSMLVIEEGMSQPAMQMTLNTFHKAGKKTQTGFGVMRELIYLSQNRKDEMIFLQFKFDPEKPRMTKDEIYNLRGDFIHHTIGDLVTETEIEKFADLEDHWWARVQRTGYGVEVDDETIVLRLHLNVLRMVSHNISMRDVTGAIANNWDHIQIAASPLSEGMIDIYAKKKRVIENVQTLTQEQTGKDVSQDILYRMFYNQCVLPMLASITVSGIEHTRYLVPQEVPVVSAFVESRKLHPYQRRTWELEDDDEIGENVWVFTKRQNIHIFAGVSDEIIVDLVEHPYIDGKVVGQDRFSLLIELPPGQKAGYIQERVAHGTLTYEFLKKVFEDDAAREDFLQKFDDDDVIAKVRAFFPESPNDPEEFLNFVEDKLDELYDFVERTLHRYAILGSVNLNGVLKLPYIDRNRTYSNNFFVMTAIFGCEAARLAHVFFTKEVMDATGESLELRFMDMFSSIAFYRGYPLGIKFQGIGEDANEFFSQATVQQADKVLFKAALYGATESTAAPSVAISVGNAPFLGTAAFKEFGKGDFDDLDENTEVDLDELDELERLLSVQTQVVIDRGEGTSMEASSLRFVTEADQSYHRRQRHLHAKIQKVDIEYMDEPSIITPEVAMRYRTPQFETFPGLSDELKALLRPHLPAAALKIQTPVQVSATTVEEAEEEVDSDFEEFLASLQALPDQTVQVQPLREIEIPDSIQL